MRLLVINGPNLNMLGTREKEIYGTKSLDDINKEINSFCTKNDIDVDFFVSNTEGAIIDTIHGAANIYDGIVLNAGAYTHYSYSIADAIKAIDVPCVEVHMSNVQNREEFRQKSVIAGGCIGVISGFGEYSYILAIMAIMDLK